MNRRFSVITIAVAALILSSVAASRAQIPDSFSNLKLLDSEIARGELVGIMRDWSKGLGVRCNHCHVGPDNLIGMDFASDEKTDKRVARRMLVMVRKINRELLADLPGEEHASGSPAVSCFTCHRGQHEPPRNIVAELTAVAARQDVDAALAHYDTLRQEHFGAGVYDFSESALASTAGDLAQAGRSTDAVRMLEKNLEHYPESADSHAMIGMIRLQEGDAAAARSALSKALQIEPENPMAQRAMQLLSAQPPTE